MNKYVIGDKCSQSECGYSSHHGDNTQNNRSQSKRVSLSPFQENHEKDLYANDKDAFEHKSHPLSSNTEANGFNIQVN